MSTTQLATKLLLSVPLLILLVLVWRSRLDIATLGGGAVGTWLQRHAVLSDTQEPNALYQDGTLVGRVEGVEIDEVERVVRFHTIYQTAPLEIARPLAFRGFTIHASAIEVLQSADSATPHRRVYQAVTCQIVG